MKFINEWEKLFVTWEEYEHINLLFLTIGIRDWDYCHVDHLPDVPECILIPVPSIRKHLNLLILAQYDLGNDNTTINELRQCLELINL